MFQRTRQQDSYQQGFDDYSSKQYECVFCKAEFATSDSLLTHTSDYHLDKGRKPTLKDPDSATATSNGPDPKVSARIKEEIYNGEEDGQEHHRSEMMFSVKVEGDQDHEEEEPTDEEMDHQLKEESFDAEGYDNIGNGMAGSHVKEERLQLDMEAYDELINPLVCQSQLENLYFQITNTSNEVQDIPSGRYALRKPDADRPFQCNLCPLAFQTRGILERHSVVHSGLRPYKCTVCGHAVSRQHTLKLHMRQHTGERPYTCTICSQRFSMTYGLKRHMKRKHPEHVPPPQVTPPQNLIYKCIKCRFKAYGQEYLINHLKKKHPEILIVLPLTPEVRDQQTLIPEPESNNEEEILGLPSPDSSGTERINPWTSSITTEPPSNKNQLVTLFQFTHGGEKLFAKVSSSNIDHYNLHFYTCTACQHMCKTQVELSEHYSRCHQLPTVCLQKLKLQKGDVVLLNQYY